MLLRVVANLDDLLDRARVKRRLPAPAIRRAIRERAALTQAEVAALVQVSRVSVTRWESGTRTPRGDRLEAYVGILDRLARESVR